MIRDAMNLPTKHSSLLFGNGKSGGVKAPGFEARFLWKTALEDSLVSRSYLLRMGSRIHTATQRRRVTLTS